MCLKGSESWGQLWFIGTIIWFESSSLKSNCSSSWAGLCWADSNELIACNVSCSDYFSGSYKLLPEFHMINKLLLFYKVGKGNSWSLSWCRCEGKPRWPKDNIHALYLYGMKEIGDSYPSCKIVEVLPCIVVIVGPQLLFFSVDLYNKFLLDNNLRFLSYK